MVDDVRYERNEFDRCRWMEDRDRFFAQTCCVTDVDPPPSHPVVHYDVELKPEPFTVPVRAPTTFLPHPAPRRKKRRRMSALFGGLTRRLRAR